MFRAVYSYNTIVRSCTIESASLYLNYSFYHTLQNIGSVFSNVLDDVNIVGWESLQDVSCGTHDVYSYMYVKYMRLHGWK